MEYIYAAMLLHSAGKEINEENLKKVLEAAEINVDEARIKVLVNALKEVNIDEVLKQASTMTFAAPAAPAPTAETKAEEKKEEKPKEEKKEEKKEEEEEGAAGLAALFGL